MISTLIATNSDTSDVATIEFTSGITSSYAHYMFVLTDIHPETGDQFLAVQFNVDGQTGYNEEITSTFFATNSQEAGGTDATFLYQTSHDQAAGTSYQRISARVSDDADESTSGIFHLFNPASTTYIKHFYGRMCNDFDTSGTKYLESAYSAGYVNVTGAIDEISFKFESGNMNGTIQMYGIA
jgi:hypothetical protein